MKGVLVTLVHCSAERVRIIAKSSSYLRHVRPPACLSVRPTGRKHVLAPVPLDGFTRNLILGTLIKICREIPNFFQIAQRYLTLYGNI